MPTRRRRPSPLPFHGYLRKSFFCLLLSSAFLLGLGCLADEDPNTFNTEGRAPSLPPRSVPGVYGYPSEPPVSDAATLRRFTDNFRPGVVLIDCWAGWCLRSREEMPALIRLQNELGGDVFQIVSCNLDSPTDWPSQTMPFLRSIQANFPCVVVPRHLRAGLRDWLDYEWDYSLPARFVLDADGVVVARFHENDPISFVIDEVRYIVRRAAAGRLAATTGAPPPPTQRTPER
jgi:thiol-disulfide isomerase/thioredoxin